MKHVFRPCPGLGRLTHLFDRIILAGSRSLGMTRGENENGSQISEQERHLCFGMIHFLDAARYIPHLKERKLQPRDFAVLFALMTRCDSKTGKIKFTVNGLADEIAFNPTSLCASLKRLKQALLIANVQERDGERFYLINPYMFSVGRKQKWGHLVKLFTEALS